MTQSKTEDGRVGALVRLSARIAAGSEEQVRVGFAECRAAKVDERWVEEVVLQSYLFAGFPRALNAAREWRKANGVVGSGSWPVGYENIAELRETGEETCSIVYGKFYEKLRANIRALHPLLDEWMIVEGYGKVLSRPGLDLQMRELCIIAACAAAGQDRQLHSHLHGALNAGVSREMVSETLDALDGVVAGETLTRARLLFARI